MTGSDSIGSSVLYMVVLLNGATLYVIIQLLFVGAHSPFAILMDFCIPSTPSFHHS